MIDIILLILTVCISLTLYADTPPNDKLKKNEEYVCVRWSGSADPTQRSPSICLAWGKKDKPWYRRT